MTRTRLEAPAWHLVPDLAPAEVTTVAVPGGDLAVARWGEGDDVVLLSHGITANHVGFGHLATLLAERGHRVYAPDHRGRGLSAGVGAPFGFARHAADLLAVADAAGADTFDLVGHSMGAFVAAALVEVAPERVRRVVYVDGGVPLDLPVPEGTPVEVVLDAVIGPAMQRLSMRWDTVAEYVGFFRAHPALTEWEDLLTAYVSHDATTDEDGRVRSTVVADAIRADMETNLADDVGEAIRRTTVPGLWLWCDRGILADPPGLYGADKVAREAATMPHLEARQVDGVNHYTIVLSEAGARAVADALADAPTRA
ncbi:MAG: alpha/beta hydrolase [Actinomycetes bacterium]